MKKTAKSRVPELVADPRATAETRKEIVRWVRAFARAYSSKDLEKTLAMVEPQQPIAVMGSGPDERNLSFAELKHQIQRDFKQVEKVSMRLGWICADALGDTGWFAAEVKLAVKVEEKKTVYPYRFSGVLVRHGGDWLLRMSHLGLIVSSQAPGQSWPTSE